VEFLALLMRETCVPLEAEGDSEDESDTDADNGGGGNANRRPFPRLRLRDKCCFSLLRPAPTPIHLLAASGPTRSFK
jgi:hypothetical protein